MFEVLDAKVHIKSPEKGVSKTFSGHVKFEDVSFSYDEETHGEEVLKNFSLEAKEGEIIALVGLSGAGTSTLISLIPRFYDPSDGRILIDGTDIKEMDLYALRSQIAMVLQEDMMFRGTVSENIRYGTPHAKEKDIIDAAKQANAWEFIKDMPSGLRTKVADKGRRLSGGQKQRISIARAILRNPRILILDEATSALDSKSETLVQEALNKLMKDRTTFVIAHRLSTIMHADKIVVLDKGEIVEVGTHNDLLEKKGHYKRLHDLQFSKKVS
jgi:subfamily B ATP-binding cassette protein MsbA